ncbi:MAG: response regulator [Gammaproteobacteria bacterium]|nr:response regulator [Gammaproteobacteria bacterium]
METDIAIKGSENQSLELLCERQQVHIRKLETQLAQQTTLYKQSELSLLRNIIEKVSGCIYWTDRQGIYLGINNNAARAINASKNEIIGKTILEVLPAQFANKAWSEDQSVMANNKASLIEEYGYSNGGLPTVSLINKIPLHDQNNKVTGLLSISTEITDRKKSQKILQNARHITRAQDTIKTELIMSLSHDIRTPFNGVLGFAQILKQQIKDPNHQEMLEHILGSGECLLKMLDEMVSLSQASAQLNANKKSPFTISPLLEKTFAIVRAEAARKQNTLTHYIDPKLDLTLIGDQYRLEKVLLNLVSNAVKYTAAGTISVEAKLVEKNSESITFCITVKDTGVGIEKDKLKLIFERFSRLHSISKEKYDGLGLGLYITKKLVAELDGEISVFSLPNQGSNFTITLDMPYLTNALAKNTEDNVQRSKLHFGHLESAKVLLVEDDEISQKVAELMLHQVNCTITLAPTGEDALDRADEKKFDVVLLDIGLPDISGFETARRLKQSVFNKDTPVIGLSAYLDLPSTKASDRALFNDFIRKPLSQALCRSLFG